MEVTKLVQDPLGLKRCVICTNAFEYDKDEATSGKLFPDGEAFVCQTCAAKRSDPSVERWEGEDRLVGVHLTLPGVAIVDLDIDQARALAQSLAEALGLRLFRCGPTEPAWERVPSMSEQPYQGRADAHVTTTFGALPDEVLFRFRAAAPHIRHLRWKKISATEYVAVPGDGKHKRIPHPSVPVEVVAHDA